MGFINYTLKSKTGKGLISLALLVLLLVFSPVVNVASAAAGSGSPNTGLPDHLTLSWVEDPLTTQTISWRTGADVTQDRVQYLPAAGFSGSFEGALEVTGERNDLYEGHFRFEATLRELAPGTEYVYRVGREGAWSEPVSFTTAAMDDQFSFLYMGDVQDGYEFWGEMLDHVAAENPDLKFALLGGDLVDQGHSVVEWQEFFAAAWPVFREISLMPAVGNHDDSELFRNSFAVPQNGPQGYGNTIYSFDYGNCHIAVLNSNFMGIPGIGDYEKIAGWLISDLENSGQRWKFLVFHHPPYPVVYDWRADVLQEHWVPLFEQCGVDMVFVGHQHVYMRTKPLQDGQVQPDGEGIVYVMGNAGTKYYGPGPGYDYIAKELAWVSNYQIIEINGDTLTITAKDDKGQIIESHTMVKKAAEPVKVTGVSIAEGDQELKVDQTFQLTAVVQPENATNRNVAWSSSNEAVATVSQTGLVTAIAEGEAAITVITEDGGFTASVGIEVTEACKRFSAEAEPADIPIGDSFTILVNVEDIRDVQGYEIILKYDPAYAGYKSHQVNFKPVIIDLEAIKEGEIMIGNLVLGDAPWEQDSGALVEVEFESRHPGTIEGGVYAFTFEEIEVVLEPRDSSDTAVRAKLDSPVLRYYEGGDVHIYAALELREDYGGISSTLQNGSAYEATTGSDGSATFEMVRPGEYSLILEADGYLKAAVGGVVVSFDEENQVGTAGTPVKLYAGDVNGDGKINIVDISLAANKYGQTGDPGWVIEDLNLDGEVDISDLTAIARNYDMTTADTTYNYKGEAPYWE
ncbi:MAG: hypothetical protein GX263_03200 [Firmicutes bacterium]|nr:hypothetical protein [Bacillota bacterium]